MKIGHLENKPATAPVAGDRKSGGSGNVDGGSAASATSGDSVQVQLSDTASLLGSTDAEFDAEKVERISQAIRDGKFSINADAIADKLIANAQELLDRTSPSH